MMTAQRTQILVAGGGLVGLSLAGALAHYGLSVTVVDREQPPTQLDPVYDGRASAIALAAGHFFKAIGLWPHLEAAASPIWDIRVVDGKRDGQISPLFLHYDADDLGDEPFGWIIENRAIRWGLDQYCTSLPHLQRITGVAVDQITSTPFATTAQLSDGQTITADLLLVADGKFSRLRPQLGIKTQGWDYGQMAVVCTVAHARDHAGTAVELFLPGGPFAMLPMVGQRSNVVWSEQTGRAQALLALDDADFLAALRHHFGDWLGDISLAGPRFGYPLGLQLAQHYCGERAALVGDAAHAIHPIAGQGLNLGLRDVAALCEILVDCARLGGDLGAASTLAHYQQWRHGDTLMLAAVTDGLTRLFSNDHPLLRSARDLGLALVNQAGPVKKFLMRHAMGTTNASPLPLPKLLRGQPL